MAIVIRPHEPHRRVWLLMGHGREYPTWPGWKWPEEFICGPFHFNMCRERYAHLTITERHLHILQRGPALTWLDLLPLDLRRAVLVPMCERIVLCRDLSYKDGIIYGWREFSLSERQEFAILRGVRPCSLYEVIDRWVSGCAGTCECPDQHRNVIKANAPRIPMRYAPTLVVPSLCEAPRSNRVRRRDKFPPR